METQLNNIHTATNFVIQSLNCKCVHWLRLWCLFSQPEWSAPCYVIDVMDEVGYKVTTIGRCKCVWEADHLGRERGCQQRGSASVVNGQGLQKGFSAYGDFQYPVPLLHQLLCHALHWVSGRFVPFSGMSLWFGILTAGVYEGLYNWFIVNNIFIGVSSIGFLFSIELIYLVQHFYS